MLFCKGCVGYLQAAHPHKLVGAIVSLYPGIGEKIPSIPSVQYSYGFHAVGAGFVIIIRIDETNHTLPGNCGLQCLEESGISLPQNGKIQEEAAVFRFGHTGYFFQGVPGLLSSCGGHQSLQGGEDAGVIVGGGEVVVQPEPFRYFVTACRSGDGCHRNPGKAQGFHVPLYRPKGYLEMFCQLAGWRSAVVEQVYGYGVEAFGFHVGFVLFCRRADFRRRGNIFSRCRLPSVAAEI